MLLTNGFITLRQWRATDAAALALYANNINVSRNLRDAFPFPYTSADAQGWITAVANSTVNLAIEVDGEAIGGIGLTAQPDVWRRGAELGYWLGEPFWGRGIATAAVQLIVDYGFRELGLLRIFAGVFESNQASCRVLEKAGFALEGRLRRAITKHGRTLDELLYARVLDE